MEKTFNINDAGMSIRCKLCCEQPNGIRAVVLCGHGFGSDRDNKSAARIAKHALDKNHGVAVLTFDWPGHGDDVKKTLRLGDCDAYLSIILKWLNARWPDAALYAYATSFGGYLFLKYLSEHGNPFKKTALRCPAVALYDVIASSIMTADDLRLIEKGKPARIGFHKKVEIDRVFLDSIREADLMQRDFLPYADDLLILHGTKDEIVPIETVRAFAENNVIEFIPIKNADHRFQSPEKMDRVIAEIFAFFGMK